MLLLLTAALLSGCSDRVAGTEGSEDAGVKDGAVDLTPPPDRAPTPDRQRPDLPPPDLTPDRSIPDLPFPDLPVPDLTVPDQLIQDLTVPDQHIPDHLVPDQLVPDQLVPDQFVPDQLVPDQLVPDQLVPDQLVPDQLVPDQLVPDTLMPDGPLPTPANCKAVLAQNSAATSGTYKVDPDGPGGDAPFNVYCDQKTAGGGWTLFMFVDQALSKPTTTNTAVDPTSLKGYHYMPQANFTALAKKGMVVRAWGIHNPELYYECGFQSAGTSYKNWKAELSCKQRVGLVAGGYKLLNVPATIRGFAHHTAYDSINPGNPLTSNSVFTKIHTSHYATGWDMPGTPGDTWVSSGYKWYYGDWVTQAKYAMIYALR